MTDYEFLDSLGRAINAEEKRRRRGKSIALTVWRK